MLKLNVPGDGSKVLLHSCCAPCSGAVLECLLANGIRPVVFFSNSNITPFSEYELRRSELARYCKSLGVTMVDDEYDHDAWCGFVLAINDETTDGFRREQGDNSMVPEDHSVLFWNQNWRRGGLQERRSQIICEQGFYNQNWCGCEFSHRNV